MNATVQKTPRPTLFALTGVRFLAALAIVVHHFVPKPDNVYLRAANEHSNIGVALFFILSGFILAYTYYSGPGAMKGSAWRFYTARFARIYPMYVVALVLMAPIALRWSTSGHPWWSGLAALTLVQAWLPSPFAEWNPPGWSLSAELFFYLLFPWLIKQISLLGKRSLYALLLASWVASLPALAVYLATGTVNREFWLFNPLTRVPEFVIGVTAGVLWMQRDAGKPGMPAYTAELALAVLVAVLCIPAHEAYTMNGACAPLIVLMILGLATGKGPLARLLSTKTAVFLGGASYSLYIIHWPVWYEAQLVMQRLHLLSDDTQMFWAITLLVLIPASCICFRFIEEPVNRYLRVRLAPAAPILPFRADAQERLEHHQ